MKNKKKGLLLVVLLILLVGFYLFRPRFSTQPIAKADKVLVLKSKRQMHLLKDNAVIKTYTISLGDQPIGHKQQEGDERTPVGLYTLDWRNNKSTCYKSIHISYPNQTDKEHAQRLGVLPGGSIMIHGLFNGSGWMGRFHRWKDWTNGCIAVTNAEMDEIWQSVANGTPIEIKE